MHELLVERLRIESTYSNLHLTHTYAEATSATIVHTYVLNNPSSK